MTTHRSSSPAQEGSGPSFPTDLSVGDVIPGGGEMGALMRTLDWSQTPLGPVEGWPQSLRTVVSTCLETRFPMLIFWGPQLVKLYNDGYRPMLGNKHPRALGRPGQEVWAEVWDFVGSLAQKVRSEARAVMMEDQLLYMDRKGFLEETYFTFCYSPLRDESGAVGGVLNTVVETTGQVLDARRLRTLRDVTSRTTGSLRQRDAYAQAMEALAANPADLPFALVYRVDAQAGRVHLEARMGLTGDSPASPEHCALDSGAGCPWPLEAVARTGVAERVDGLAERLGALPLREGVPAPTCALVLPMVRAGEQTAASVLVLGLSPRLALDASYRSFLELVASSLRSALDNARAHEEARQRAEALAELDRQKTAFFSNVSHEFRTPLTLMLGPLEDLITRPAAPLEARDRERLALIQRNSQRLLKLVNSLLEFNRLEAGRVLAAFAPTDLSPLTAGIASAFASLMQEGGLRLVVDCPPLPQPVWVDPDQWEKIVLNLLSNAFKFTFQGEVAVRLRWREDRVELSVQDTGTGIPEAEQPRVFERFHRVEGARGRSYEGSGIGLAMVHALVTLHGGAITLRSAVGQGSTFTVSLPTGSAHLPAEQLHARPRTSDRPSGAPGEVLQEAKQWLSPVRPADAAPAADTDTASSAGGARGRILLADDNADLREYVRRALEGHFQVEAVTDGQAALEAARRLPPDVVLTDVMMPGMDGFGLLRELKADARTAHLPVILLSARAGEEAKVEGLGAGADDYLVKPFGVRELVARLEGVVHKARSRAQREELLAALQLSETRYRLATRATQDAIWDWNLLTQEVIWNEGVSTLFGHAGDAVGSTASWWYEQLHPEDRERVVHGIHVVIDAPGGSDWRDEYRFRRHDGTWAQVEDRGQVARDASGKALRMVGAMQDVTLRRQAEATLRQSEEEFRTLAEALPETVFTTTPDGRLTYVNGVLPRYTGLSPEALLGDAYPSIIDPEQRASSMAAFAQALQEGRPVELEHRVLGRDGALRWHLVRALPVRDARGQVLKWVGMSMDVHELREAQAQLQQRSDFEQQLIGIVSHDLRNPVSAILLGAASLMRREELDARSTKAVSRIQSAAERAHRMIRDLLDFTQARLGGGLRIQRRPMNLHELMEGVLEEVEATHPDREIHRKRSGDGQGEWDPDRLAQMAQNLVTNALKYSPRDTPVRVETRALDGEVVLSIHNEGTPIPPERLGRLFQPLQRASGEVDTTSRSIGLGLYIVKQLAEAHGGTVAVESTARTGTTFTVRLPRTAPADGR